VSRLRIAALVLACINTASPLHGTQLIVHEKPIRLRHIAGTIVDRSGMTIPYALVELRDAGDQHVMASTYADGYGKFFFADRKHGENLNIRISLAGFDPAQYSISIAKIGKERFRAVLELAT